MTTETRPGALAQARRERDTAWAAIDRLSLAVEQARRGGATVMRLDQILHLIRGTETDRG